MSDKLDSLIKSKKANSLENFLIEEKQVKRTGTSYNGECVSSRTVRMTQAQLNIVKEFEEKTGTVMSNKNFMAMVCEFIEIKMLAAENEVVNNHLKKINIAVYKNTINK